jgi:hypothetical protein
MADPLRHRQTKGAATDMVELGQTYELEVPVEVREWIAPALASPALVA